MHPLTPSQPAYSPLSFGWSLCTPGCPGTEGLTAGTQQPAWPSALTQLSGASKPLVNMLRLQTHAHMGKQGGGTQWLRTPAWVSDVRSNIGFPLTKHELWTSGTTLLSFHYYI